MHFDVLRVATIRKLNPYRKPKANYTWKSQKIGLTKKIFDIIPVDSWIRGCAQFCGLQDIFLQIVNKKCQTLLFFSLKESHRSFRGSECSTAKPANVFRLLPGQQVVLLPDP